MRPTARRRVPFRLASPWCVPGPQGRARASAQLKSPRWPQGAQRRSRWEHEFQRHRGWWQTPRDGTAPRGGGPTCRPVTHKGGLRITARLHKSVLSREKVSETVTKGREHRRESRPSARHHLQRVCDVPVSPLTPVHVNVLWSVDASLGTPAPPPLQRQLLCLLQKVPRRPPTPSHALPVPKCKVDGIGRGAEGGTHLIASVPGNRPCPLRRGLLLRTSWGGRFSEGRRDGHRTLPSPTARDTVTMAAVGAALTWG